MGGRYAGVVEVMAEQCTGRGRKGVVVAAAPIAAGIGAEALRAGGNAFDAVVAAALAETVLLPPKCGLAGDLVALRLHAGAGAPEALLAIGPAPRGLAEAVRRTGGLPETGPFSVGVPGAPAGYAALAALGRLPLAAAVAPAAELARAGIPWSPICTVLGEESASLVARHNPGGTRYFPGGRPPEPGDLVALPGLASALDELAVRGARLFEGPVGAAIAATVRAAGGVVDEEDLRTATAEWVPAAHVTVQGWDLWATPAPTHGPSLLDAVQAFGPDPSAAQVLRAVRSAAERRRATLGDPLVAAGTSMVSAADAEGNVVTVVHSNSYPRFGSGLVVDDYDLILANRAGRGFTPEEGHPNHPAPGRRPATTLHAWAAGPIGRGATLVGGTPGGVNQVPWNAQMLAGVVGGRTNPGRLVVEPRWEWSPTRGSVTLEDGATAGDFDAFRADGLDVDHVERWALRCAQQVVARPQPGTAVVGAVDPRTGGLALGV